MKTIVLNQPGQLFLSDSRAPAAPADREAVVCVRRVGVCGTDLHAFQGNQPFFTYPRVLGHELAVEVVSVSENEPGLAPGSVCAVEPYLNCGHCYACRRGRPNCCVNMLVLGVHIDGGLREFISVPTAKLHPSRALSLDQLALVEPLSIGAHAVARAQLAGDECALVIGVGPIGLAVIQFASLSGARIFALDPDSERLAYCQQHFGVEVLSFEADVVEQLQALTAGDLPAAVFDATGNPRSMSRAFDYVAHGGRLVFVGLCEGEIEFSDPNFHRREMTLLSSRNATGEDFRKTIALLEQGKIEVASWISHRVAFRDVPAQFPTWVSPKAGFIKAVIEVS